MKSGDQQISLLHRRNWLDAEMRRSLERQQRLTTELDLVNDELAEVQRVLDGTWPIAKIASVR